MKNTKLTMLTIAAVAIALPLVSQAKERKTYPSPSASPSPAVADSPSPEGKADRAIPYHGKISAVDAAAKTFTIQGKEKTRTFKITKQTKLEKSSGAPATWSDVKVDEEVRGSYWKKADGSLETKSVKLGPKTPEELAAEEARKAKKAAKAAAKPTP
jgi:predicted Zn-dependent protease